MNVCTASGLVLDATRNDPQNQNEFARHGPGAAAREGLFSGSRPCYSGVIANPQLKSEVEDRVDEKSSWFRLRTNIRIGTAEFVLYSLLYREPTNRVRTVQRSFGSE